MSDDPKKPNPVDSHVGARVRARRVMVGMSQDKLGESLGLTFQQIQKYEKGMNRIGAGRLWLIAKILGVPVSFFFDGLPADIMDRPKSLVAEERESYGADVFTAPDTVQLAQAFARIKNQAVRKKILDLVKSLSD